MSLTSGCRIKVAEWRGASEVWQVRVVAASSGSHGGCTGGSQATRSIATRMFFVTLFIRFVLGTTSI